MGKEQAPLKERGFGLYGLALKRLEECGSHNQIISFPDLFEKLCRSFQIKKREAWEILFLLRDLGFLKIVPTKGVTLYG
jgi:hypothetical protein